MKETVYVHTSGTNKSLSSNVTHRKCLHV